MYIFIYIYILILTYIYIYITYEYIYIYIYGPGPGPGTRAEARAGAWAGTLAGTRASGPGTRAGQGIMKRGPCHWSSIDTCNVLCEFCDFAIMVSEITCISHV